MGLELLIIAPIAGFLFGTGVEAGRAAFLAAKAGTLWESIMAPGKRVEAHLEQLFDGKKL
jgi:hypothetical protein